MRKFKHFSKVESAPNLTKSNAEFRPINFDKKRTAKFFPDQRLLRSVGELGWPGSGSHNYQLAIAPACVRPSQCATTGAVKSLLFCVHAQRFVFIHPQIQQLSHVQVLDAQNDEGVN